MRFAVDAIFVISLERRSDRLGRFCSRFPDDWPLQEVEVFRAVDGSAEARPPWWRATAGAWGCYQSHLRILRQCLDDGVDRVLVLEDDVTFAKDFAARLAALDVPGDCQQLYLGGQHLAPPEAGPAGFVVGRNVNRTHAYAVFGREALELLVDHLRPERELWASKHHIDHHYGILHRERRIRVYAAQPWLCGQVGGRSDVGKSIMAERWWRR